MYPILLDLSGRLVVIIGGGAVAARKARGLLEAGAGRVRCIAPRFGPEMPAGIELVESAYAPAHLNGADLVFAATDQPAINQQVVQDARLRGVWANRADPDEGQSTDFATPALLRLGEVLVAVSAGGNPALAAALRDELSGVIDRRYERMAAAMSTLRPMVLDSGAPIERRRSLFRQLATPAAIQWLGLHGEPALIERVKQHLMQTADGEQNKLF